MTVLDIKDLRITIADRNLVDGVNINVEEGEIVGLAGESGSGKSLTSMTALGFLPDGATSEGQVKLFGDDLLKMKPSQLRKIRGIKASMIFQDPMTALHPMLTIERQLTEHQRKHLGVSKKEAIARAIDLLERVRIPDAENAIKSYPHQFSGGMRQRIAIASALACEPKLLIADEVTTALDVTVQAGILRLLDELRRDLGTAILFITHDLAVMNVISDRLYIMQNGKVIEEGPSKDVLAEPKHSYTKSLVDALPVSGVA